MVNHTKQSQGGLSTFGRAGAVLTPSDTTDHAGGPFKGVVALTGGNISILPADSDVAIPFVAVTAGFVPPYVVRRVLATGTTVSVASIEG